MTERTVLISGAGIAGSALAFWLQRYGLRPVVVERADKLRLGGQNVDIRGAGREVTRRMGIERDILAATTGEKGLRFVDRHNVIKAEFPAGTTDAEGFTAEIEILRNDLARLIYEKTIDGAEYVFGDYITDFREHDSGITVSFAKGNARDFDIVIAADGIRSRTRSIVFGDEVRIRDLGAYVVYFTIPRIPSDKPWWYWYNAPGGRTIQLRPDNVGTTRVLLSFMSEQRGYEKLSAEEQKAIIRRIYHDAGWEGPRVLSALDDASDIYVDAIGQVLAPQWSRGRVALVGDAGYCPSLISGMGTSLALVGAYVLAGEVAKNDNYRDAFASYERIMRPYVHKAQKLAPGAPRLAHPKTKIGIGIFHIGARIAAGFLTTGIGKKQFAPPADDIVLPDYSAFSSLPSPPRL